MTELAPRRVFKSMCLLNKLWFYISSSAFIRVYLRLIKRYPSEIDRGWTLINADNPNTFGVDAKAITIWRSALKSVLISLDQWLKKTYFSHRFTHIPLIFVNFKNHREVVQC